MTKLKLGPLIDEKPVRLTVELPAQVRRDLVAYGAAIAAETGGGPPVEPAKLIAPMLARFMATDRAFARRRREDGASSRALKPPSSAADRSS